MASPYLICPHEWERTTLEPDETSGFILDVDTGSTPSTKRDDFWDGQIPWLTPKEITDLGEQLFVSSTERNISEAGLKASAAKLMAPGTVMLTKRAPVGAVVVNAVPMATNQGFLSFTCGPRLRAGYLAAWLKANNTYLYAVANGSTYPELYKSDLFEFEVSLPPVDYQDRVLAVLAAFRAVLAMESSLAQLVVSPSEMARVQKTASAIRRLNVELLPQLLSGGISLKDIDIPESLSRSMDVG